MELFIIKCCQCDKQAIFTIGPNEAPLCLHCNALYQKTQTDRLNSLNQAVAWADQNLHEMLGVTSYTKSKAITFRDDLILNNININNSNIGMLNTDRLQAESIDLAIGSLKNNQQN